MGQGQAGTALEAAARCFGSVPDPCAHDGIPGPRPERYLLTILRLARSPLHTLLDLRDEHGDFCRLDPPLPGPPSFALLSHPDHVRHVLQTRHPDYPKSENYEQLGLLLGRGLLTSEGDHWLRHRRMIQPLFHRRRLATFVSTMAEAVEETLERWEPHVRSGRPVDVAEEMNRLALSIVGRTLLGTDVTGEAGPVARALPTALRFIGDRMDALLKLPLWVPTSRNRAFREAADTLDGVVRDIIEERRRSDGRSDLLALLMEARDEETGEGIDDRQLRDEVMTMFLAGHETTANALAWTWWLLDQHPSVDRRLAAEARRVLGNDRPTADDLDALELTGRVVRESMRLLPPVWMIERKASVDDEIGGHPVPEGTVVLLSQYVTHRHPAFWEEPARFDPDRFLPDRMADRHRFAYFPFARGPRQCIGRTFALMEATIALAMIRRRLRLRAVPEHPVRMEARITLRPRHGLRMTLHRDPESKER